MNHKTKTCWLLSPGPIAYRKQMSGIANALGLPFEEKIVKRKKPWCWLPKNWHLGALKQLDNGSATLLPPWPDIVISSGQYTIPYALAVRQANGGKTKLIHIQKPTIDPSSFDVVIAPEHDHARGKNLIETFGATHDVTTEALEQAAKEFAPRFSHLKQPFLSIFIGGTSKKYDFTPARAAQLASTILDIAKTYPGTLLISGSRRTGEENMTYFDRRFRDQPNIHLYNQVGKNPYMGMLALADTIMVTDDSISMISESAFTGKPLYILKLPEQEQRKKIGYFIDEAVKRGYVKYFEGSLEPWGKQPLDEVGRISDQVKSIII